MFASENRGGDCIGRERAGWVRLTNGGRSAESLKVEKSQCWMVGNPRTKRDAARRGALGVRAHKSTAVKESSDHPR